MALTTVTVPGPTGTPVPLADFGIPVANNINELITELTPVLSAWTPYTPVWSSTSGSPVIGNGSINGRFVRLGNIGWMDFQFVVGTTTTYPTGEWRFSLPPGWTVATITPIAAIVAPCMLFDATPPANKSSLALAHFDSGQTYFDIFVDGGSGAISASSIGPPQSLAWGTNDSIQMSARLELAP